MAEREMVASLMIKSSAEALNVLKLVKSMQGDACDRIRSLLFDKQLEFIDDQCRWKAADCSRRAGKTFTVGAYLLWMAYKFPGCNCLYLARSRTRAKEIVAKDVFGEIIDKLKLQDIEFVSSELRLKNGSRIGIAGADADKRQISNVVGTKYRLVCLDEGQYWSANLWKTVNEGLRNAMQDQAGTITMIGVPSSGHGFFYDVVTKQRDAETGKVRYPAWSVHKWHATDNPHQREAYLKDVEEIRQTDPGYLLTPTFRQQYLGEWVVDPDSRCYAFTDKANRCDQVPGFDPTDPDNSAWQRDYEWSCGMDTGFFPDPMGFVVMCHRKDRKDQHLYIVESHKQLKMSVDEVGAFAKQLESRWPISQYVCDPANANIFNELQKRFDMPMRKADKMEKTKFMGLLNDDVVSGKLQIVGSRANSLVQELKELVWKASEKGAKRAEDPSCDNHLTDSLLYGWRDCWHYQRPAPPPEKQDDSIEATMKREEEMLVRRHRGTGDPIQNLYEDFKPSIFNNVNGSEW